MTTTDDQILDVGRRWAEAEVAGDVGALDELAVTDFTLVGPVGFVLDRHQWLERYRGGDFSTTALSWDDVTVRDYGDAAVAVGIVTQEAAYQGQPSDGRFRVTQVLVRRAGGWQLAGLHYSPVAAPPGAPPG